MSARAFRLKILEPSEAQILGGVLEYLAWNPRVAWVARINNGAGTNPEGQYVNFNRLYKLPGATLPDILGQLKNGRLFALETKRQGVHPTSGQLAFLSAVAAAGGLSAVVRSVEDVRALIPGAH
jgi:hypothetical protein